MMNDIEEQVFGWLSTTQVDIALEDAVRPVTGLDSVSLKTGREIAEWLLQRDVWDTGMRLSKETRKHLEDLAAGRVRLDARRVPRDRLGVKIKYKERSKRYRHWKQKKATKKEWERKKKASLKVRRPWKWYEKKYGKMCGWEVSEQEWVEHIAPYWENDGSTQLRRIDTSHPFRVGNVKVVNVK